MFAEKLQQHVSVFNDLTLIERDIIAATALVSNACQNGHTVFVCGNGGSAADAQHFAAELTGRYVSDRQSYPGIALTVDTSAMTAIANDYGYQRVFSRQLEGLGNANDVLVAISTSGHSENVIEAVKVAQAKGIKTIGLLGRDGGELSEMVDIAVTVPSKVTARIQEAHIFILHYFCEALEP